MDEREFIRALIFELVSEELDMAAWPEAIRAPLLEMQYQARMRGIRENYPQAVEEVLRRNGAPVGWIVIARSDGEIRLVDIAVLAQHRGTGLASARLRELIAEAAREGKPLRLSVAAGNRAIELYRRLGFVPSGGDGVRIFMERLPG